MPIYALEGNAPERPQEFHWISDTAVLIGKVRLHPKSSIWFGAVLRGDNELIEVGEGTNIQENCVLHTDEGFPLTIGKGCTIGHKAMLHGCTIGDNTLIGMGATVLNGATVGKNCLIGACALITEGKEIPDNSLVVGAPGKILREVDEKTINGLQWSANHYMEKSALYAQSLQRIE